MDLSHYRTWHLASNQVEISLTEFEYGVLRFREAFEHWVVQAVRSSSSSSSIELNFSELIVLHTLRMQPKPAGVAILARLLNRDDVPNIQYSLRKLAKVGLVQSQREKGAKSASYVPTEIGIEMTNSYARTKREILFGQLADLPGFEDRIASATRTLTTLTGLYEECARVAATHTPPEA
jgi:predicted MarR family transcription regulator